MGIIEGTTTGVGIQTITIVTTTEVMVVVVVKLGTIITTTITITSCRNPKATLEILTIDPNQHKTTVKVTMGLKESSANSSKITLMLLMAACPKMTISSIVAMLIRTSSEASRLSMTKNKAKGVVEIWRRGLHRGQGRTDVDRSQ